MVGIVLLSGTILGTERPYPQRHLVFFRELPPFGFPDMPYLLFIIPVTDEVFLYGFHDCTPRIMIKDGGLWISIPGTGA